jgi:hypothetical protein
VARTACCCPPFLLQVLKLKDLVSTVDRIVKARLEPGPPARYNNNQLSHGFI